MKSRFALVSLLAASAVLAACGWLLPDGVLEATAEDAGAIELDSGEAGIGDSGAVLDAGDPKWSEPVLLRGSTAEDLILRPGVSPDAGDVYFSERNKMFYAARVDAVEQLLTLADGGTPMLGVSPIPTFASSRFGIAFANGDALFFALAVDASTTAFEQLAAVDCGVVRNPYSPKTNVVYFSDGFRVFRFSPLVQDAPIPVTFVKRSGAPVLSAQLVPVITASESTIYFAEGVFGSGQIWTATHSDESGLKFIDAHPLFPDSTGIEFPTAVSADGKELIFTRVVEGGSAAYKVTQLDP